MDQPPPYPGTEKGAPPPTGYSAPYPQQPYPPAPGPYPQQPYPPAGGAPPPQGSYGPPPQPAPYGTPYGGSSTVVVQQPAVMTTVIQQNFRDTPVTMQCPHCRASIVTGIQFETGTLAWLACVGLCVVGCDFGCCLIPFCVDGCKDVIHTCPNCSQVLGRYNRL